MKQQARVDTAQQDRRVRRLGPAVGIAAVTIFAMGTISSSAQAIGECANNTPANPPAGYNVIDLTNGGNPNGTGGADFIWGTDLRDVITAGGGDDIVCGRGGDDFIDGEAGNDEIYGMDGPDEIYGGPERRPPAQRWPRRRPHRG